MKKYFASLTIIMAILFILGSIGVYAAEDWTQYESGTNNMRLDGYHGQPGYIAFGNGNGTVLGYMWFDDVFGLVFCSKGSQSAMTTGTSLQRSKAVPAASNYSYVP